MMYEYNDVDGNIICGDFYSRIGDLKDFVPGFVNIRQCLDLVKAGHYIHFIDFLNFTSISKKGCSVIDYVLCIVIYLTAYVLMCIQG